LDEANALCVAETDRVHIRVTFHETPETPARLGASNRFLFLSGSQSLCWRSAGVREVAPMLPPPASTKAVLMADAPL